jgi:hypothetical protein
MFLLSEMESQTSVPQIRAMMMQCAILGCSLIIRNGSYFEGEFGALSSLLRAFGAQAVELDLVPAHLESKGLVGPGIQALIGRGIEIDDGIALLADEVIMGPRVGIETIECASKGDPVDASLLDENADVPIDGPQAEVGEFLAELDIQPVRRWVSLRRLQ